MSYFNYKTHAHHCDLCKLPIARLTNYRKRFTDFCRCKKARRVSIYGFDLIKVNEVVIYPWNNIEKCHNYNDSNNIRCALRQYIKKSGREFYVRRHLAGIEVTRLA